MDHQWSLSSTLLPHHGYVDGPAGPAFIVSGCLLPKPSRWLLQTIRLSYVIQFTWNPPKFSAIHFTLVNAANASVLHVDIAVLLAKDAIEPVPPADMKTGIYGPYFIVPKKGGGHISTRSCPSGFPCPLITSGKLRRQPLFSWDRRAFPFSSSSTTGSY